MIIPHFVGDNRQILDELVDEALEVKDVNLTNCDREPIHRPNSIQPHGLLIVFDLETLELVQVSENLQDWTGHALTSLRGKTLAALFDLEQIKAFVDQIQTSQADQYAYPVKVRLKRADASFFDGDALIRLLDAHVFLEIESALSDVPLSHFRFFEQIKLPVERLQRTQTLADLCQVAVNEVQTLTGFDRVMIYRFHPDGSGSVIAESAKDDAVPYLGLRYPSTDIPQQAKQLYAINWLRMIPDVAYEPVPMWECTDALIDHAIDMSHIGLRSVSPMHVEYLHNMGVKASLSISLLHEGKLWGLIACHHSKAKRIDWSIRTCCEFVGQVMSSELASKARYEVLQLQNAQKSTLNRLESAILSMPSLPEAFRDVGDELLHLVQATGAAYLEQDRLYLFGDTPDKKQVRHLLTQLQPCFQDSSVFTTPRLSQVVPEAETYASVAAGVLGLAISKTQNIYLLWFRPEVHQFVNWAGDPRKSATLDENGQLYLSPRQSFNRWVETVLLSSESWSPAEVEIALDLRSSIIGMVLQKADELAKVNLELARSNDDLASFAYVASHDLKAPLRAIANLACWIQEDLEGKVSADTQAQLDLLQSRVYRMHDMIQGLLQYSRVGDHADSTGIVSVSGLLTDIVDSLSPPPFLEIEFPQDIPLYETNKTLLKQVLTNLLSNAIKYIGRPDGHIRIQVDPEREGLRFEVIDNGPGIEPQYHDKIFQMFQTLQSRDDIESTGIGLAIVKKVVLTQGGQVGIQSDVGQGCRFTFTWPKATLIRDFE